MESSCCSPGKVGKQGHAPPRSVGHSVKVVWIVVRDAISCFSNELTPYILHLAQLMLEDILNNDDYRCQLQARRSFTVTDMSGHLLWILWVSSLAQEPLLIANTMIIHLRHVWHSVTLDVVREIFFTGWTKFPEDAITKILVFKELPVLFFFFLSIIIDSALAAFISAFP